MVAATSALEAKEEALEVVATLDAADPPARGVAGRVDTATATPRVTIAEGIGATRGEAPTEPEAPAPRRTAARAPRSLS